MRRSCTRSLFVAVSSVAVAVGVAQGGGSLLCGTAGDDYVAARAGLRREWVVQVPFDSAGWRLESVTVGDTLVVACSSDGGVHAVQAAAEAGQPRPGSLLWSKRVGAPGGLVQPAGIGTPLVALPTAGGASLVTVGHDLDVHAFDAQSGVLRWTCPLGHATSAAAVQAGDNVYCPMSDDGLMRLPANLSGVVNASDSDGQELDTGMPIEQPPVPYAAGDSPGPPAEVPEEILSRLDSAGLNPRPILLAVESDMDLKNNPAREWLVVTPDHLIVTDGDRIPRAVEWSRVQRVRVLAEEEGGVLRAKAGGDWIELIRYSKRLVGQFEKISRSLDRSRVGAVWINDEGRVIAEVPDELDGWNVWSFDTRVPGETVAEPAGPPAVRGATIYVVTRSGRLDALRPSPSTGGELERAWTQPVFLPGVPESGPIVAGDRVIVSLGTEGIVAYSALPDDLASRVSAKPQDVPDDAGGPADNAAAEPKPPGPLWRTPCGIGGRVVAVAGERVWFVDAVGRLASVDVATGEPRECLPLGGFTLPVPATVGDRIVLASPDGLLVSLAPRRTVSAGPDAEAPAAGDPAATPE